MRILITKKGEEIRLDILNTKQKEEEKRSNSYRTYYNFNLNNNKNYYNNTTNIKKNNSNSITNIKNINPILTNYQTYIKENNNNIKKIKKNILNKKTLSQIKKKFFNRDELNINLTEMEQSIPIKIKKTNIKLTNKMEEKYNDSSSMIEKLRKSLEINNNIYEQKILPNLIKKNNFLKLSEILTPKKIIDYKIKYFKDEKEKFKKFFSTKNLFRFNYENDENKEKKINKLFEKKISNNRTNLINYIKNKENISNIFIKKINDLDDEKIYKLNNVCRNYFTKSEYEEKSFKNLIEKKKLENNKKIKLNFSKSLKKLKNNFVNEKKIFNQLDKNYDINSILNRKYYEIKHKNYQYYWKKYYTGESFKKSSNENNSEFSLINNSKEEYVNNNIILFDN